MNKFWRWLSQRKFMQEYTTELSKPEPTVEEAVAVAVLAIVEKYNLQPGQGFRGDCFPLPGQTLLNPIHFQIEVCDSPEVCFGVGTIQ